MGNDIRLLVVDDEEDLCEILQFNLQQEGYQVDVACSAEEAIERMSGVSYALILLDVMMEGMSGFEMAEHVRKEMKSEVPIIFLTAKSEESDLLQGFGTGADDYICKPFSIREVIVRVKAVLRRNIKREDVLEVEGLKIDAQAKMVLVDGKEVVLTKKEFEILLLLFSSPNKCFSRAEILKRVWTDDVYVLERTVDVHITRLRKKIGVYGKRIINRSHYGYIFES